MTLLPVANGVLQITSAYALLGGDCTIRLAAFFLCRHVKGQIQEAPAGRGRPDGAVTMT